MEKGEAHMCSLRVKEYEKEYSKTGKMQEEKPNLQTMRKISKEAIEG